MAELPILGRCSDAPRSTEASTMSGSADSRKPQSNRVHAGILPRYLWLQLPSLYKLG